MKKEFTKEEILKDLKENHNWSWFEEIKHRSLNHMNKVAFRYRGKNVTYKEFIDQAETVWAPAFRKAGITKGTRVFVSVSSAPEICFLMAATSIVGAKINFVADDFDADYLHEISKKSKSSVLFVGEDRFELMKEALEKIDADGDKKIISLPLDYSLPNGNPFSDITDMFETYNKEESAKIVESLKNKQSIDEFLEEGKSYNGPVYNESSLDDEFTITYSSGTTDGNKPKGIVHRNKHYVVMGRYHDSEVSHIPNLKNSVTYSTIPTQSNSYIASIISDTLMEGACIALDPIATKEYFLYGVVLNKPLMAIATTSSWLYAAKFFYSLPKEQRKNFYLKDTLFPVAVGEPMSPGEEKFLNKFLKDCKCGVNITKLPRSISKMSICGGDCEHGSIFIRELRAYANLKKDRNIKEPIGLRTYNFVDVKALREDGTYCENNEYGRLVANSACTMTGYDDEPERTERFFIADAYGKKWADLGCYGFVDKDNNIYMKGRMSEDISLIPEFVINDEVQRDAKNVLSSSVVYTDDGNYVIHIQKQPDSRLNDKRFIDGVINRCRHTFGDELIKHLYINLMDFSEDFPLTGCLKRDNILLRYMGVIDSCVYAYDEVDLDYTDVKKKIKK